MVFLLVFQFLPLSKMDRVEDMVMVYCRTTVLGELTLLLHGITITTRTKIIFLKGTDLGDKEKGKDIGDKG